MDSQNIAKNKTFSWKDILSVRDEIYGLAILFIILYHFSPYAFPLGLSGRWRIVENLLSRGNIGVDIFLFFSAIGCYRSMNQHSGLQFYENRVKRVAFPYLSISLLFFIYYDFIKTQNGFVDLILNISTVNFWLLGNWVYPLWYMAFIVVLYVIFPAVYKADKESHHKSTCVLLCLSIIGTLIMAYYNLDIYGRCEVAFSRIPVFLIGLLFAERSLSGTPISNTRLIALSIVGLILFLLSFLDIPLPAKRYLLGFSGVMMAICYSYVRKYATMKVIPKVLSFAGVISLELYLSHMLMIKVYDDLCNVVVIKYPSLVLLAILFLSVAFSLLARHLNSLLLKRK